MAWGLIAGLAGSAAKKLLPKAAKWVGQRLGSSGAAKVATGIGVGTAVVPIVRGAAPPPPPPMNGQSTSRQPRGIIRRTIEKVLPGGRSGYELTPYEGTEYDRIGRPIAVHGEVIERMYVPPGYVVVDMPDGERIGVLREVARSMGLWKPRPKPPITAGDARAIRRANSARKRVKRLAGDVGFACHVKGRGFKKRSGAKR